MLALLFNYADPTILWSFKHNLWGMLRLVNFVVSLLVQTKQGNKYWKLNLLSPAVWAGGFIEFRLPLVPQEVLNLNPGWQTWHDWQGCPSRPRADCTDCRLTGLTVSWHRTQITSYMHNYFGHLFPSEYLVSIYKFWRIYAWVCGMVRDLWFLNYNTKCPVPWA